jgi:hypothetical protein
VAAAGRYALDGAWIDDEGDEELPPCSSPAGLCKLELALD